jgi:CubicO group peptidase (beta-lactamase class C family)
MNNKNEQHWVEVAAFIQEVLKKSDAPGCSVGVLVNGEILSAGFGVANVETGRPVSEDTLFQIGSITKTFTATAAMQLVEAGKLDLEKPVRAYLPDFKVADEAVSAGVTVAHLLSHTAGWDGDLFLDTGDGEDAIRKYIQRMAERGQLFPLGGYFSYNNAGFAVMGGIIEAITGEPIEAVYREQILKPIGMDQVYFNAGEAITYDFAVGHRVSRREISVARPWRLSRAILPMGGFVTNVSNLLRYAQCYISKGETAKGERVLKSESVAEMFSPKMTVSEADRTTVGTSWFRRDLDEGYIVSHGGGTNGQLTQLSVLPDHQFALAIFTNSSAGGKVIQDVHDYLLKSFLDITLERPQAIESTPEQLAAYTGTASRPGFTINFEMLGDHLVQLTEVRIGFPSENDPPPPPSQPSRVGRCAEDRLIILDGDGKDMPIDVFRDESGKIAYLRAGRMYQFTPKN